MMKKKLILRNDENREMITYNYLAKKKGKRLHFCPAFVYELLAVVLFVKQNKTFKYVRK